jgi:ABC-type transporter Mla MlaB component
LAWPAAAAEHQVIGSQATTALLALDGAQTVRTIDAAHRDLVAALAEHATVTVDCSAVTEVDLSLIQLLLAARASARLAGKTLGLTAPANAALRAALVQGGLLAGEPGATGPEAEFWLCGTAA